MKKIKGFTLTEVIITMILVITLALISMPLYKGRYSNKAKIAEGYALLGTIKDAQISYYNEYGYFLHSYNSYTSHDGYTGAFVSNDRVLGINAVNNKYFSVFCYDNGTYRDKKWIYSFLVQVKSEKAGTITQMFNLTERSSPVVIGGSTDLSF